MSTKTYSEKLRHPLWQKRRLEILDKAGFTCQLCYDNQSTLHVHHLAYRKGAEPWDYKDHELLCLCERCHSDVETDTKELITILGKFPPELPIYELLQSLVRIYDRDPWEIWHWFNASRYPDLLIEADRRRGVEVQTQHKAPEAAP